MNETKYTKLFILIILIAVTSLDFIGTKTSYKYRNIIIERLKEIIFNKSVKVVLIPFSIYSIKNPQKSFTSFKLWKVCLWTLLKLMTEEKTV